MRGHKPEKVPRNKSNKPERGGGRQAHTFDDVLLNDPVEDVVPDNLPFGTYVGGTVVGAEHDAALKTFPPNPKPEVKSGERVVTAFTPDYTAPVSPGRVLQDVYDEVALNTVPNNPNFSAVGSKDELTPFIRKHYTEEDFKMLATLYQNKDYTVATVDGYEKGIALMRREISETLKYLGYSTSQISALFDDKIQPLTEHLLRVSAENKKSPQSDLAAVNRTVREQMIQAVSGFIHTVVPGEDGETVVKLDKAMTKFETFSAAEGPESIISPEAEKVSGFTTEPSTSTAEAVHSSATEKEDVAPEAPVNAEDVLAYRESVRQENQLQLDRLRKRIGELKANAVPAVRTIDGLNKKLEWQLQHEPNEQVRAQQLNDIYSRLFDLYNSAIPVLERLSEEQYKSKRRLGDGDDYLAPGEIPTNPSNSNRSIADQEDVWQIGGGDYARANEHEENEEALRAHRKNIATSKNVSPETSTTSETEATSAVEPENVEVANAAQAVTPESTGGGEFKGSESAEQVSTEIESNEKTTEAFIGQALRSIEEVEVGKQYWLPRTAGGYTQGTAESANTANGRVKLTWEENGERFSKRVHFSMLSVEEPFAVPQDEIVSEAETVEDDEIVSEAETVEGDEIVSEAETVEGGESAELRTLYRTFSQARKAFLSPELLAQKKSVTDIEKELKSSGLSERVREELSARRDALLNEIGSIEEKYEAAKEPYVDGMRAYLRSKGTLTEEQINLMIAGRFFARTKAQRYQAQENRSAELNEGAYRSYKDVEMERKEALLDLEQKSVFKKLMQGVSKIPPRYKMGLGGAVVAGSIASGGLLPMLVGMTASITTRFGVNKLGMSVLDRRRDINRVEQINAVTAAKAWSDYERTYENLYQKDKRNRKIVTGLGYVAGTGAAMLAGGAARAEVGEGSLFSKLGEIFGRDETLNANSTDFYLGLGQGTPGAEMSATPESSSLPVSEGTPPHTVEIPNPYPSEATVVGEFGIATPAESVPPAPETVPPLVEQSVVDIPNPYPSEATVVGEFGIDTPPEAPVANTPPATFLGSEQPDLSVEKAYDPTVTPTAEPKPYDITGQPESVPPAPETVSPSTEAMVAQKLELDVPLTLAGTPNADTVSEQILAEWKAGKILGVPQPGEISTTEFLNRMNNLIDPNSPNAVDSAFIKAMGIESGDFTKMPAGDKYNAGPLLERMFSTEAPPLTVSEVTAGTAEHIVPSAPPPPPETVLSNTPAPTPPPPGFEGVADTFPPPPESASPLPVGEGVSSDVGLDLPPQPPLEAKSFLPTFDEYQQAQNLIMEGGLSLDSKVEASDLLLKLSDNIIRQASYYDVLNSPGAGGALEAKLDLMREDQIVTWNKLASLYQKEGQAIPPELLQFSEPISTLTASPSPEVVATGSGETMMSEMKSESRPFISPETLVSSDSFINPEFRQNLDFIYRNEFGSLGVPAQSVIAELTERVSSMPNQPSFAEVKELMSAITEREYVLQQMQPGNHLDAFNQVIRNESIASLVTEQGQARLTALEQTAPDLFKRLAGLIELLPKAVTSIDATGSNGAYSVAELLEYGLKTNQLTLGEGGQQLRGLSGVNLSLK